MADLLGPLTSRHDIEQAVINQMMQPPTPGGAPALVYWLADLERQHGLTTRTIPTPQGPSSWRGEIDFETLQGDWLPLVGVGAKPAGTAERYSAGYVQPYTITVRAFVADDSEDLARAYADHYGTAIAGCLLLDTSLGGVAIDLALTSGPTPDYLSPDTRQVATSTVEFDGVFAMASEAVVPSWPTDPYSALPAWTTATSTNLTLDVVADDQPLS